jgi:sterol desaturase/sphingolipid hydroxylase (fatty acid hydroxylase superfamily)
MNYFGINSIFFPPYLISAIIISLFWIKFKTKCSISEAIDVFFSKKVWLTKSMIVDIQFSLLIILVVGALLAPTQKWFFENGLAVTGKFLDNISHASWTFQLPVLLEGIMATLVTMLSIDFASFLMHRWMHANNFLRKIHSIHHSAKELNFFTTYRQHILEPIILNLARTLAAAIGLSIFHLFFKSKTPVITYHEIGIGFFIYMFTVNLHHSHVPVSYPKFLRFILISPHIHHLHHSLDPRHRNTNFGVVFSFWDRAFGSYHDEDVKLNQLRFGIEKLNINVSIRHGLQYLPPASAT